MEGFPFDAVLFVAALAAVGYLGYRFLFKAKKGPFEDN